MGKVVKYCNTCEEGFAEKFGFCPNCGSQLTAFEMNPLNNKPADEVKTEPAAKFEPASPVVELPVEPEIPPVAETRKLSKVDAEIPQEPVAAPKPDKKAVETPVAEIVPVAASTPKESFSDDLHRATYAQSSYEPTKTPVPHFVPDTGYSPTIVVEKNVKQRNTLLLGAFTLGIMLMLGSYVYSMFNKFLDIAAIETGDLLSYVEEVDPVTMDLEEPPKKQKDDGGGGGGGGKEEETAASKGREATQVDNPLFAPSAKMDRVTNPDIAIRAATQGNRETKQTDENYGAPQGLTGRSDGTGTGGGIGEGRGRGQGNGNGTGLGNGNGSGFGNGNGNGNGDGDGDGDGLTVKTKPSPPVGPTEGVKILSKPRANYTDAARQNQVQGKVVLRVTFAANGSIGAIAVISGLGNGLTEQAIAAARGIRFEPAKRGGQPYTVTKPVEYSFTIY